MSTGNNSSSVILRDPESHKNRGSVGEFDPLENINFFEPKRARMITEPANYKLENQKLINWARVYRVYFYNRLEPGRSCLLFYHAFFCLVKNQ